MKRIYFLLAALALCLCISSCTKEGDASINGKWYDDYSYHIDKPDDIEYYTNGEFIIIDGDTITFQDGDMFDGVPVDFSYKDGKVHIAGFVWTVNKLTKTAMEWQSGNQVNGFKR